MAQCFYIKFTFFQDIVTPWLDGCSQYNAMLRTLIIGLGKNTTIIALFAIIKLELRDIYCPARAVINKTIPHNIIRDYSFTKCVIHIMEINNIFNFQDWNSNKKFLTLRISFRK